MSRSASGNLYTAVMNAADCPEQALAAAVIGTALMDAQGDVATAPPSGPYARRLIQARRDDARRWLAGGENSALFLRAVTPEDQPVEQIRARLSDVVGICDAERAEWLRGACPWSPNGAIAS